MTDFKEFFQKHPGPFKAVREPAPNYLITIYAANGFPTGIKCSGATGELVAELLNEKWARHPESLPTVVSNDMEDWLRQRHDHQ